jgi:hypothetical protein
MNEINDASRKKRRGGEAGETRRLRTLERIKPQAAAAVNPKSAGNHRHSRAQEVEFSAGTHRMRWSKVRRAGSSGRMLRKRSLAQSREAKWP